MSQRHNGSTKRKKPQDIQLGILKIYAFSQRIQQKASGPGESTAWVAASSSQKLLQLYLVVQERTQLEHSSHIAKVGVEATC